MLTQVEVQNTQGSRLRMPLGDYTNGLIVKDVEGLDPVKATLVSTSFANQDGEQYHSSRRESRNIVIKLGIDTGSSVGAVSDIRSTLYKYFMPKALVQLRFVMSDGLEVDIEGRVEDFGAPLFSQKPEVDISIMCFNPDFYKLTPTVVSGSTTPVTSGTTPVVVNYQGTVESGFVFTLNVNREMKEFTIYHESAGQPMRQLEFSAALLAGDVVKISTVPGQKSATLTRGGLTTSILYGVDPRSSWHELQPGFNNFRVYAVGVSVPYTIEFTTKYGGL